MPAVSKAQFRFMKAVEGGYIHPTDLSKSKAEEFTQGVHLSKLPDHVKSKFSRIKKKLKKEY